jgi:hypothetical protein
MQDEMTCTTHTGNGAKPVPIMSNCTTKCNQRTNTMKTILNAIVALGLIAGVASTTAHAFDAKSFFAQQAKDRY